MRTVDEAQLTSILASVAGTPRVVVSGNAARPAALLRILDQQVASYRMFVLNAHPPLPDRDGVVYETAFVGPGMRHHPRLAYVPARLSLVPHLFRTTLGPDVVLLHAAPPGPEGKISLGVEVNILPAAVEACRARGGLVIAQVDPAMPYTFGDAVLEPELVDYVLEAESGLGGPAVPGAPDDASRQIGDQIVSRIADGATVQLGIGAVPDATLAGLSGKRGLTIWSEMFSDGVVRLGEHGALDGNEPIVASFVLGSPDLYSWVDRNPRVRLLRTETTNDPSLIARNRMMTSINSALEVDLFGQANASRINARIHSGFGGQTDFIVGAIHSDGGQAIMALRSWHPKANVSTIVPLLDEPVTSFQHTAVVTENGIADIFGYDERSQARQLIEQAAHPSVRDELWEEARELGLA